MRVIYTAVLVYLCATLGLAAWYFGDFFDLMQRAIASLSMALGKILGTGFVILPLVPVMFLAVGRQNALRKIVPIVAVTCASIAVQLGFAFFKDMIPDFIPYYADPALAGFDNWLHFGNDPWRLAHEIAGPGVEKWMPLFYMDVWTVFAALFPMIVVASDPDAERARRYLWLFFGAWLVLGNILALAGSSVGPIYYDRLLGSQRFADLTVALQNTGFAASRIGEIQQLLWSHYSGVESASFALGISAFPSMHLAVAMIAALYAMERSRHLVLPAIAFVTVIFFISVYSGYHYAIDGYVSIALVWLANRYLRVRDAAPQGARMFRSIAASQLLRSVR